MPRLIWLQVKSQKDEEAKVVGHEGGSGKNAYRLGALTPISLAEPEVLQRHRCAAGSHVVFIGTSGLASMVMRGQLTHSVLQQTLARHGANSSYIMVTQPVNDSSPTALYYSNKLERHFDQVSAAGKGGPARAHWATAHPAHPPSHRRSAGRRCAC